MFAEKTSPAKNEKDDSAAIWDIPATLMMLELKRLIAKRADGSFEARG